VAHYCQELDLKAVLAVKQVNTTIPIKAHKKYDRREDGMCGEDSLSSTNCLRLDKPKLFSFFANHSFSTVTSKKRTKYTSAFKTKLVLELLQNKSTLVQIASKHNILPQNLQNQHYI
jgi:hypothetical protein